MIQGSWRVQEECVNQDTGKRLKKGARIHRLSSGEYGRLQGFGYIASDEKSPPPAPEKAIDQRPTETRIKRPPQTRKPAPRTGRT